MAAITRLEAATAGALPTLLSMFLLFIVSCTNADVYLGNERYDRMLDDTHSYSGYYGQGDVTLDSKIYFVEKKSQKNMTLTIETIQQKFTNDLLTDLVKADKYRFRIKLYAGEKII